LSRVGETSFLGSSLLTVAIPREMDFISGSAICWALVSGSVNGGGSETLSLSIANGGSVFRREQIEGYGFEICFQLPIIFFTDGFQGCTSLRDVGSLLDGRLRGVQGSHGCCSHG
jgi:hypothetical protein